MSEIYNEVLSKAKYLVVMIKLLKFVTMELSKSSRKRAQVFSGEFLLAYFIFSLALVTTFYLWNNINSDILESERLYDMEEASVDITEKLVNTGGLPNDWNSAGQILSIGLANDSRILDHGKILKFIEIMNASTSNYEDNKYLLGIGKYDFYLSITDINGSIIRIENRSLSTGKIPINDTYKITAVRTAIFNNTIIRMRLTVWK